LGQNKLHCTPVINGLVDEMDMVDRVREGTVALIS